MPAACMAEQLKIKMPNYTYTTCSKLHTKHIRTHTDTVHIHTHTQTKYRDISKLS